MSEANAIPEESQEEPKKAVKLNKDGLEPGQMVDFDTMRKIEAKRAKKKG